jgi:membrane-bound lytic murein transglycosylase MltF
MLEQGYNLPSGILNAIAFWESRGTYSDKSNPNTGARGLFQLRDIAIQQVQIDYGSTLDPNNVYQASLAASMLLNRYFKMFNYNTAISVASYNWGEGNVKKLLRKIAAGQNAFIPLETRDYIQNVIPLLA